MADLVIKSTRPVSLAEVRRSVEAHPAENSVKEYFKIVLPNKPAELMVQVSNELKALGIPQKVVYSLLALGGKVAKGDEVALICNSMDYKVSVSQAEKVMGVLRKIR